MHAIPFNPETFARNLAVLAHRSPEAARRIYDAPERTDIEFGLAPDGAVWATIGGRQLASRRAPLAEGEALAATIDPRSTAAVVVNGFGVGHHVRALALRLGMGGALFVFEPDVSLLRSVFGRVDCSGWLALANFTLFTNAEDQAAIASAITGCEGLFASGTRMVDHPASRARLGESLPRFSAAFASVMQAVRTQVVTTLVQVDTTLRNLLQNLDWYCRVPGIADLSGCAKGRAAVVVSAGPSLHRTIDQLLKPGVRERVVIIAVQTCCARCWNGASGRTS